MRVDLPDDVEFMEYDEWVHEFAKKLNRVRISRGVSINELAKRSDVSVSTIKRCLGEKGTMSSYNIYRLAKALDCKLSIFIDF